MFVCQCSCENSWIAGVLVNKRLRVQLFKGINIVRIIFPRQWYATKLSVKLRKSGADTIDTIREVYSENAKIFKESLSNEKRLLKIPPILSDTVK